MSFVATAIVVTGALTAGSSIYGGEQARKSASKGLRQQREAQRQSLLAASGQQKIAAQAEAAANRKKPNIESLLYGARGRGNMGPASTLLAGSGGTPLLGSKSLMG